MFEKPRLDVDKFKEQNLDYMPLGRERHPTESWR